MKDILNKAGELRKHSNKLLEESKKLSIMSEQLIKEVEAINKKIASVPPEEKIALAERMRDLYQEELQRFSILIHKLKIET